MWFHPTGSWASYSTSFKLGFFTYKMGMMTTAPRVVGSKIYKVYEKFLVQCLAHRNTMKDIYYY